MVGIFCSIGCKHNVVMHSSFACVEADFRFYTPCVPTDCGPAELHVTLLQQNGASGSASYGTHKTDNRTIFCVVFVVSLRRGWMVFLRVCGVIGQLVWLQAPIRRAPVTRSGCVATHTSRTAARYSMATAVRPCPLPCS